MKYLYTLAIVTENCLEIINRLAIVFSRNRLIIQKLNFERKYPTAHSTFQIEVCTDAITMDRVIKQIERIVELVEIQIVNQFLL